MSARMSVKEAAERRASAIEALKALMVWPGRGGVGTLHIHVETVAHSSSGTRRCRIIGVEPGKHAEWSKPANITGWVGRACGFRMSEGYGGRWDTVHPGGGYSVGDQIRECLERALGVEVKVSE